jgi:hypothetical protein
MEKKPMMTHEEVLRQAGFDPVESREFPTPQEWDVDSFIGYLYSTSIASKVSRADVKEPFEVDLRRALLDYAGGECGLHDQPGASARGGRTD